MAVNLGSVFFNVDARFLGVNTALRNLNRTDAAINRTNKSTNKLTAAFKGLGAAAALYSGVRFAKGFVAVADQSALLNNRIRAATSSQEEFNKVSNQLIAISNKTGTVLRDNAQLYQRLAISAKSTGGTTKELLTLTETVANLGRVSGSSSEDIKNSTRQLAQGLGSTFFRAEEFNSIIEQMPAVISSVADELGITTGELNAMVKEGKLLSKDVFQALIKGAEKARAAAERLPLTFGESFNVIKNSIVVASSAINDQTFLTTKLGAAARTVGELITGAFYDSEKSITTNTEATEQAVSATKRFAANVITLASYFSDLKAVGLIVWKDISKGAVELFKTIMVNIALVAKAFDGLWQSTTNAFARSKKFIEDGLVKLLRLRGKFESEDSTINKLLASYDRERTMIDKVIPAYAEKTKAVFAAHQAIKDLTTTQEEFAKSGGSADSIIGQSLAGEVVVLKKELEAAIAARRAYFEENGDLIQKAEQKQYLTNNSLFADISAQADKLATGDFSIIPEEGFFGKGWEERLKDS
jgi:tape measure domain-containing protein